jgi:hypothetical protein
MTNAAIAIVIDRIARLDKRLIRALILLIETSFAGSASKARARGANKAAWQLDRKRHAFYRCPLTRRKQNYVTALQESIARCRRKTREQIRTEWPAWPARGNPLPLSILAEEATKKRSLQLKLKGNSLLPLSSPLSAPPPPLRASRSTRNRSIVRS